jgi:hypothetical protein
MTEPRDGAPAAAVRGRVRGGTGPNTGYADLRLRAPATGWISSTALGSAGELIIFVEDPARPMSDPIAFPADCPPPTGS